MNPRKKEFAYDFFGSKKPRMEPYTNIATFSVGIFQWILKASGRGLKKSAVKYRVKGLASNPGTVYKRAEEICEELDQAFPKVPRWFQYQKSEIVKD